MSILPRGLCFILGFGLAHAQNNNTFCEDPVGAIVTWLDECWPNEDFNCSAYGYDVPNFRSKLNGVWMNNGTVVDRSTPTVQLFLAAAHFSFDINHAALVGENIVSIRFTETVTMTDGTDFGLEPSTEYPWAVTYSQWEHVLATLNSNCQVMLWDVTGDKEEQNLEQVIWADLLATPELNCILFDICLDPSATTTDPPTNGNETTLSPTYATSGGMMASPRLRETSFIGLSIAALTLFGYS